MLGRDLTIYLSVDTTGVVRVRYECKQRFVRVPVNESSSQ